MLQVARTGTWASIDQQTRFRYLRLLVVLSLQAGLMKIAPPRPKGPEGRIEYGDYDPKHYPDISSLEIASTVLRTLQMILPPGHYNTQNVRTEDGDEPILKGPAQDIEVGAFPLVIWVAGIAACAVASVLIAQVAGDVVDRQLTRKEDTRRLISAQASAVEIVMRHAQREDEQGTRSPYNNTELMVLEFLLNIQRKIVDTRQAPLPTPFAGAAQSLGNAMSKVGTGFEMAIPIAVAGGIFFLLWSRK
jgi:hypothetical protein